MQAYSKIAETFLRHNKPEKLNRLRNEGKLEVFLNDIDEEFDTQEYNIILQVCTILPEDNNERRIKINRAQIMAREIVLIQLIKFLENME